LAVQASTDAVNWMTVHTWTTSGSTFLHAEDDLSLFDGQGSVYVRFRFTLAGASFAYVDIGLLGIRCVRQTYFGNEYALDEGTSMASPHVAGAAALLWARNPAASVAQVRSALLNSVDPKPSLTGKTVTGGRLNLASAVARMEPFDHPAEASPLTVSLVPDFRQTISANQCAARGGLTSTHGPPLTASSCQPAAYLPGTAARIGTAGSGSAQLTAVPGNPSTAADEADLAISLNLTDVRSIPTGADYLPNANGPDVTLTEKIRLSDTLNGPTLDAGGTTSDFDFPVQVSCAATASTSVGSTCTASTSADAITPGKIKESRRMVLQTFRVRVTDSGANGTPGNADDRSFAQQGFFVR
jgi:hypothetical protein